MKRSKTSTRKSLHVDRRLFNRPSNQVRRRASHFKLESLEERTLLSSGPPTSVLQGSAGQTSTPSPSSYSVTQALKLQLELLGVSSTQIASMSPQQEVNELKLLSTGQFGTTTTSASPGSPQAATSASASYNPHLYTGEPANLGFDPSATPPAAPSTVSTSPGQYNPSASQAAMAALAKTMRAVPQYLVFPSSSQTGASPLSGDGPYGGLTPQQLQGAYGVNNITFSGGIQGNGAGQTIAVIDAGDNPSFLATTDPNYGSSALAEFDSYFGLPDPPSFQKYDQYGNVTSGVGNQGWGLEIALDVEWAHAMAPRPTSISSRRTTAVSATWARPPERPVTTLGAIGRVAELRRLPRLLRRILV